MFISFSLQKFYKLDRWWRWMDNEFDYWPDWPISTVRRYSRTSSLLLDQSRSPVIVAYSRPAALTSGRRWQLARHYNYDLSVYVRLDRPIALHYTSTLIRLAMSVALNYTSTFILLAWPIALHYTSRPTISRHTSQISPKVRTVKCIIYVYSLILRTQSRRSNTNGYK